MQTQRLPARNTLRNEMIDTSVHASRGSGSNPVRFSQNRFSFSADS
jgi:hypothetical protein